MGGGDAQKDGRMDGRKVFIGTNYLRCCNGYQATSLGRKSSHNMRQPACMLQGRWVPEGNVAQ